ncbi:Lon protease C-terminal proteolytic domain-domain-containing protein [Absidia repens]|uniref:Lon protease homolog n=1 Tax=Absidia repens TaxID=90262 RepID=A0A1X2IDA4_9FUNG|nr:Lon protease C-terminal proteolytic domain-domain-containing protein [Absidia repens]
MDDRIPTTLPLVPLYDKVLLPSIVTKVSLDGYQARSLSRKLENSNHTFILCVPLINNPLDGDFYHTGCVANVLDVDTSMPDNVVFLVQGVCRAQIQDIHSQDVEETSLMDSTVELKQTRDTNNKNDQTVWIKTIQQLGKDFINKMQMIGVASSVLVPFKKRLALLDDPSHAITDSSSSAKILDLAHFLLCMTDASFGEKLAVLSLTDCNAIVHEIQTIVTRHMQILNESKQMQQSCEEKLDKKRREFYLRQQTHVIAPSGHTDTVSLDNLSLLSCSSSSLPQKTTVPSSQYKQQQKQQQHQQQHNDNGDDDNGCLFMPTQGDDEDVVDLKNQLNNAGLPSHIQSTIKRDLARLSKIPGSAPESVLVRTYLEWIADLPWRKSLASARPAVEISVAKQQLDADHFGLDQVKRRILEYLSVLKIKKDTSSPILCFVGPPGVGKTSLSNSIAKALQRKFHRIALGGVRDEAEIRGHRRTYVGALPGSIINGLRKCGVNNPLFLLDEIDKLVQGTHQGDPASALLEVLDPAQNNAFTDHFLNVPFDLSNVLFVATANSVDTIPGPLLDRMEVIHLDGYTLDEKLDIARSYLIPKQLNAHGFTSPHNHPVSSGKNDSVVFSDQVLSHLIENYTMESGVRSLNRTVAAVCRYKCREYADHLESNHLKDSAPYDPVVRHQDISTILGMAPFGNETLADSIDTPGIVTGLAYSQSGCGGILPIEANQMPGRGMLHLTGSLGDVIKESAHIAVSWVKANAYVLKLTESQRQVLLSDMDLHLHLPNGAVPKDGPSAGVAMAVCIISLLSGKAIPRTTAMTGEITLRGQVRPVGGIKEKVLAAHRAGVNKVILPAINERDVVQDIPDKIKNDLTIVYCRTLWEVLESLFDEKLIQDSEALHCQAQYASRL